MASCQSWRDSLALRSGIWLWNAIDDLDEKCHEFEGRARLNGEQVEAE